MILSNKYQNLFLDLFRGYSIPAIEKLYIGLMLKTDEEVSGDSYARIEYDASPIAWLSTQGTVDEISTGDTGEIKNVANISWGIALENWGIVDRIRFYLEPTGLDYICDHEISETNISNGDLVEILSDDFSITTRDA